MNHAVVGIAHHHANVALTLQADVLQGEVADDGSVGIAEEAHIGIYSIIIIMIGPHVLDGMTLSVEHAAEGMLGGADGYQGIPVITFFTLLNEVLSQADGIVAHVIAAVNPGG